MYSTLKGLVCAWLAVAFSIASGFTQTTPQFVPLTSPQLGQRLEYGITNVVAAQSPFDPDVIRLDATITTPSGRNIVVPAFWYLGYQRAFSGGSEIDSVVGAGGWRLRFTPMETGAYSVSLTIRTNGQVFGSPVLTNFNVPVSTVPARMGYVGIAAGRQYFQTGDGQALRLIGENVCWFSQGGTYDYDTYFPHMQAAGENYARIWMCPWAFGIEDTATSLNNYNLLAAWQLDYVLQQAEQRGIYLLLCLDYHGMFATEIDMWGGNNYWPQNPYNTTNGGPCAVANDFFANGTARAIYEKRLRYLVARYGYSQNLLAWEFLNEIDNDYAYLNPSDVASWHAVMGGWLHTNDPFGHLVTTSLTGSSDRPEIWTLPQLDFAAYHSYNEPLPATRLNAVAQSFLQRYGKPVLIGEFGTDSSGWGKTNDPYLRGWRQGIWGGALGGSVGTAMSWWWDDIEPENDYPTYSALASVLNRTGWGTGGWTNIGFQTSGNAPADVGTPIAGAAPVNVQLPLDSQWGGIVFGKLAVPGQQAVALSSSTLESFVHGIWHSDLKTPFIMNAWFTNNARLVMHLNSVSDGAVMVVLSDGIELYRTNLPNLDAGYTLDEEYNMDFPVNLPAGNHSIQITNAGTDWFFLDWVRLEQVLPSNYSANWTPTADAIGLSGPHESLLYVIAPGVGFPANATTASPPAQTGLSVALTNWPAGTYTAEWYDPATAALVGITYATTSLGVLTLPLPAVAVDIAGVVYPPPMLSGPAGPSSGGFQFRLDSETGGRYQVQQSGDMRSWATLFTVTNVAGSMVVVDPAGNAGSGSFYRVRK